MDSCSVPAREDEWEYHTLFGGMKYDKQLFPNILDYFERLETAVPIRQSIDEYTMET